MAPLRYAAKLDPFLSLACAPTPSALAQSKERKESNFAIWQPWTQASVKNFQIVHDNDVDYIVMQVSEKERVHKSRRKRKVT